MATASVTPSNNASDVTLHVDELDDVAEALLLGLAMYGDLMEKENSVEVLRLCKREVPDELIPCHPTGTCDVATIFANALRTIIPARQSALDRMRKHSELGTSR
jgi:hypothetical protein